jgi:multisubunit Na+/H+ antiporter MnhC subunit
MRFFVVTMALLFVVGMVYLTAADFVQNGVTGLGIVGAIVVAIVSIGTIGSFLHPPRRTEDDNQAGRAPPAHREERD